MLLVQKWPFFQHYFLGNIGKGNVFYDILERKTPLQAIKKKCKNSENSHFSKGVNACFWSKNRHFSKFIFQTIYARKVSFTIFQNEKTPFQGLTHAFGPKMAFFIELFFSRNIGQENVFYDILERKNASLGYKKKFKKSEN